MDHVAQITDAELFVLMYLAGMCEGLDTMVSDPTVQMQLMQFRVAIAGDDIGDVKEFIGEALDAGEEKMAEVLTSLREKLN
ncbi:hypothetical protein [Vibrio phage VCPH]|nr:hypothetical protein [Vibrio phage VCPH]